MSFMTYSSTNCTHSSPVHHSTEFNSTVGQVTCSFADVLFKLSFFDVPLLFPEALTVPHLKLYALAKTEEHHFQHW
ncbi:Protein of unknown function [Cotesia congregata]|uniref:Uncharacterized protein n=1 Tax=Cotesia congregata TaxID=51543 RepID=A0A8J2MRD1_COTCN|nr:Protein of unknown function [Cotesia congregata]